MKSWIHPLVIAMIATAVSCHNNSFTGQVDKRHKSGRVTEKNNSGGDNVTVEPGQDVPTDGNGSATDDNTPPGDLDTSDGSGKGKTGGDDLSSGDGSSDYYNLETCKSKVSPGLLQFAQRFQWAGCKKEFETFRAYVGNPDFKSIDGCHIFFCWVGNGRGMTFGVVATYSPETQLPYNACAVYKGMNKVTIFNAGTPKAMIAMPMSNSCMMDIAPPI